ncbi:INE-like protein [Mya arenaria]|uniref:INE-like protein n=1 Tax=Mya arenaria TaxID=6604 RepID=A0ABY7E068_MYAAR|nr:INE-like protein [Mya arenaria]
MVEGREKWSRNVEYLLATAGYAVGLGNVWRFPYLGVPTPVSHYAGPVWDPSALHGDGGGPVDTAGANRGYQQALPFFQSSFTSTLPWADCNHDWNSEHCFDGANKTILDPITNATIIVSRSNDSLSPSEDFFEQRVLEKTSGIDEPGALRWDLSLILLMCWILVYFCIWKGPRFTGKVWVAAAAQTFNSLGIAFGGIITMSSYNSKSHRILKDVLVIGIVDALTCILAGLAIFSILGYLAYNQGMDVEDVIKEGPGLVFVIYPAAFTSMPVSQLISVLFFLMLVTLGIDSQFASVEVIVTTIQDHFGLQVKKYLRRKEILVLVVCIVSYLCGLPNVTQGGIYFFQLIDYYAAAMSLMYLAFFEGIWIFSLVQYKPFSMAGYEYPTWATVLGWLLAAMSIVCIPAGMVHTVISTKGNSLWEKFRNSLKPLDEPEEESLHMNSVQNVKFLSENDHLTNGTALFNHTGDNVYPQLDSGVEPLNYRKSKKWEDKATTLGKTEKRVDKATTLGKTEKWEDKATTLGKTEKWVDKATTLGKTEKWVDKATTLGKTEKWVDKATTLGKTEKWEDKATTLGKTEKWVDKATTLGKTEKWVDKATTLGKTEKWD